jgi:lipoyl(octanoyl) transferase
VKTINSCYAVWLGKMDYSSALDLQMEICRLKKQGFEPDVLLLLEHPPVITLGRNAKAGNLLVSREGLRNYGVDLFEIDRGGDITFHGPGQLVGYPILKLGRGEQDVHAFMRHLEDSLISLLAWHGIHSWRRDKLTGVWTSKGKIAAMGIHISRWITRHGFALNVTTDLSFFQMIIPCGLVGQSVTSMEAVLSRSFNVRDVASDYTYEFGRVFARRLELLKENELRAKLESHAHKITVA